MENPTYLKVTLKYQYYSRVTTVIVMRLHAHPINSKTREVHDQMS